MFKNSATTSFCLFVFCLSLSWLLQLRERAVSWRRWGWLKGSVGSEEDCSTAATTRATEQVIFHDKSHMVMQHSEPIKHAHSISIRLPDCFVILELSIDQKKSLMWMNWLRVRNICLFNVAVLDWIIESLHINYMECYMLYINYGRFCAFQL